MTNPSVVRQSGSVIVEFALSFMIFWTALIAVIEFSRYMFSWSTANEATRLAARMASICDQGVVQESFIRARVKGYIEVSGQVDLGARSDWLVLSYFPAGCNAGTCRFAEAKLQGIRPQLLIPGFSNLLQIPEFRVRVPRESMRTIMKDDSNAACN